MKIEISERLGAVSTILNEPEQPRALMTLAHGAGANMEHPFMEQLARQLAAKGIATLRFNFPFTEAKKGRPDPAPVAEKTISRVIEYALKLRPDLPLFISGKSFGGRMSSGLLSKQAYSDVKGIVFYGFPLHAAGKPDSVRGEHLSAIKIPMLFLQGTRDALATLDLMQGLTAKLPNAILRTFEGADHSFKAGKRDVMKELTEATVDWIDSVQPMA